MAQERMRIIIMAVSVAIEVSDTGITLSIEGIGADISRALANYLAPRVSIVSGEGVCYIISTRLPLGRRYVNHVLYRVLVR